MKLTLKHILIFIALFSLVVPSAGNAQALSKKGLFNLGVEGGIQFTNIRDFSGLYQAYSGIGYSIGGFAEYYISGSFKVRGGVYFDNRVFQLSGNFPFIDSTGKVLQSYYLYQVDYGLNYLTIPLNIIYQRGSDKFKVTIQGGVYYSIYLFTKVNGGEDVYIAPEDFHLVSDSTLRPGHNETLYSGTTDGVVSRFYSSEDYLFRSTDFGLNVQIGFLYNLTPQIGLTAGFGFSFGFNNLFENPEIDSKWTQITKINIGFLYTLKKKAARRSHNPAG
ncbi:MAG: PorT family protein [Chlorobi bacterium]|nr:PorT family protein [Chlorobiota bacterium]